VRNNASEPTLGHVIMFGAAATGWLILFLINLALYAPTTAWWLRAVFSGVLLVVSVVFTFLLWRRFGRKKIGERRLRP
jgi:hypothetical protein